MNPLITIQMYTDKLYRWLAWKFPKDLVKWVLVRAMIKTSSKGHEIIEGKDFSIKEVIEGWSQA